MKQGTKQLVSQLALLFTVSLSWHMAAAEVALGPCPEFHNIQTFDMPHFLGRWYEIERYPASFEDDKICAKVFYGIMKDGATIIVNETAVTAAGEPIVVEGNATLTNVTGQLQFSYVNDNQGRPVVINVLDTDYYEYSSLYYCQELQDGFREEFAWIRSRQVHLDAPLLVEARKAYNKFGIDTGLFITTQQGVNCTYI